ncbi:MAG: type II toxin-antitoxin system VapC family toxin [Alphaproteobacteria bacterium]|nr:type II toxin-antitoxin system VapC family toxin [Alphaproteobacteria bacterium]
MKLLLDTHAVLWWFMDDPHLSARARAAIANPANQLIVSAAVGYEIAYKQSLGRLPPLPQPLPRRLLRESIEILPITLDHALAAAALPGPHRDPWDRIMMAQAVAEQCLMVTVDKVFSDYKIPVLW